MVKRVKSNEHLITKNTIIEDDKVNKNDRINNIIIQKTNSGMNGLFGFPLRLHVYNLARPNIDSIINADILSDSLKVKRKTKLLSKKQFDKWIQSKRNFNSWLPLNLLKTLNFNVKENYIITGADSFLLYFSTNTRLLFID